MSSCDNSNIRQNYIVTSTNEFDTFTACTGIWTSNIYGCSPITIHDSLNLLSVPNNNSLDKLLVIDNLGSVQFRDVNTLNSGGTEVIDFTYNNANTFIIDRFDSISFSATINEVTGLTVNGDLYVTETTYVNENIEPYNDGSSDIGSPIKRFRDINTISGTSSVWTSTIQVITPNLNLGLDSLGNQRIITANNSVIQDDILIGGNY